MFEISTGVEGENVWEDNMIPSSVQALWKA